MFEEFLLKMTVEGAVSFILELVKLGFEGKHLAKENRALVREARTLWSRKLRLEGALRAYSTLERSAWIPAVAALESKPLTEETVRRRMRKHFGLSGPFMTGEPTPQIAESAISRHERTVLSSQSRNQALSEVITALRAHLLELAASVEMWDRLEDAYCMHLAALSTAKKATALALKRRMRKAVREATLGLLDAQLLSGKHALRLVSLPSRMLD